MSVELLAVAENTPSPYGSPPPTYHEAITDAPPNYTSTDCLAHCHIINPSVLSPTSKSRDHPSNDPLPLTGLMSSPAINFDDTSNIQSHTAKNKRQTQKKANQAKWANSDDEGNKEDGNNEENGKGGGGSNHGDGGAGDDGDDWDAGKKKKGKKGKKGKQNVDEEEEKKKEEEQEQKKKEEEEQRKKDEEEAASGENPLAWTDGGDANPDDEWVGFMAVGKKGKKGKKGKV